VETNVFIALGSNQGDRELNLLRAIAEVGKLPGCRVTAVSHFYDTEPVGDIPQDNFLNAAIRIETELSPDALLTELQRIETGVFGRKRSVQWGPRPMDLDILFYGEVVADGPMLTIPHPRLHERRFVLQPLADIAPDLRHPLLGKSVQELLAGVTGTERVTRI